MSSLGLLPLFLLLPRDSTGRRWGGGWLRDAEKPLSIFVVRSLYVFLFYLLHFLHPVYIFFLFNLRLAFILFHFRFIFSPTGIIFSFIPPVWTRLQ